MKLAVVNLKGGTGKTTTATALAAALNNRGRTLLVDADPQGSGAGLVGGGGLRLPDHRTAGARPPQPADPGRR